jgi:hypothetical protein
MDSATSLGDEARMTFVIILLGTLLGIGITLRNFNTKARLLVLLVTAGMIIYISLK